MAFTFTAPCAAQWRGVMACAVCTTSLMIFSAPAWAQDATVPPCDPATEDCPAPPPFPEPPTADGSADLVLPTVEVAAEAPAAPAPRRAAPPPRRAAPAPIVAAPAAPAAAAPVDPAPRHPDSRFATRPARVQDRTTIGELSIDTPIAGTVVDETELASIRSV